MCENGGGGLVGGGHVFGMKGAGGGGPAVGSTCGRPTLDAVHVATQRDGGVCACTDSTLAPTVRLATIARFSVISPQRRWEALSGPVRLEQPCPAVRLDSRMAALRVGLSKGGGTSQREIWPGGIRRARSPTGLIARRLVAFHALSAGTECCAIRNWIFYKVSDGGEPGVDADHIWGEDLGLSSNVDAYRKVDGQVTPASDPFVLNGGNLQVH